MGVTAIGKNWVKALVLSLKAANTKNILKCFFVNGLLQFAETTGIPGSATGICSQRCRNTYK